MQKKYLALPLALICLSAIMTLSSAQDEWWKECKVILTQSPRFS